MAEVAKAAGVPRESLYRALPVGGNPRFSTFHGILRAAGLRRAVLRERRRLGLEVRLAVKLAGSRR